MKMKFTVISFYSVLLIILLHTTIANALPRHEKRQEPKFPNVNSEITQPFLPLETTPEPITRYYNLTLSLVRLAPDGFTRSVWAANGQYPGPMIRANKGDRLIVVIQNDLPNDTTIHWHGIFQVGSTFYDGVAGQTQCPIPSGRSFVYNFSVGEQYGTYWWHSHYLSQYVDGLRGPLIVHDPEDPYLTSYDEEYVMTLSDWYHTESIQLVELRSRPGYVGGNPIPDSGLVSGVGRYDCSRAPEGSECTPNNPYAVYTVQRGKRYRIRVINTSAEVTFTYSIDQHPLSVIEVEGENVRNISVNKINIAVGQRYSFIVTADKEVGNFWIRAQIVQECIRNETTTINRESALNYNVTAILRYEGASAEDPTTLDWNEDTEQCRDMDHNLLKLYTPRPVPGPVTDPFTFIITFRPDDRNVSKARINGNTFVPDLDNPTVLNVFMGGNAAADNNLNTLEPDQNAYYYDTDNGTVEITLVNDNNATHPFHLHGHNFFIMGHGTGKIPDQSTFNTNDPAVRDTVSVLPNSWTVIRFPINNPGVWAFHCHIEWHVEMGMVGQLIERPSVLRQTPLPEQIREFCPNAGQTRKRRASPYDQLELHRRNSMYRLEVKRGSAY